MADVFTDIEAGAVAMLSADPDLATLRVVQFPDNPRELGRVRGSGLLLVRCARLQSADPAGHVQSDRLNLELRLLTKELRTHTGAYPLLARCRALLTEWVPTITDPDYALVLQGSRRRQVLWHTRTELIDSASDDGLWQWGSLYALNLTYTRRH